VKKIESLFCRAGIEEVGLRIVRDTKTGKIRRQFDIAATSKCAADEHAFLEIRI